MKATTLLIAAAVAAVLTGPARATPPDKSASA